MPGSMDGLKLAAAVRDRWPPIEFIVTIRVAASDQRHARPEPLYRQTLHTLPTGSRADPADNLVPPAIGTALALAALFPACPTLPMPIPLLRLCLPQTRSDNTDDEVRRGSAEQQVGRTGGSVDGPANPCPTTDVFGIRCNSWRRPQRSGADGLRRSRRCEGDSR
jgi:hypothetical protein